MRDTSNNIVNKYGRADTHYGAELRQMAAAALRASADVKINEEGRGGEAYRASAGGRPRQSGRCRHNGHDAR